MTAELIWRKRALTQLEAIFDYIRADNPKAAKICVEEIIAASDRLRHFPLSGRAYDNRYRILVVRNHLVLYRHEQLAGRVILTAVLDGRRDVAALLRQLDPKGG